MSLLTCGEADIERPPNKSEQGQAQGANARNPNYKLLVSEEVLGSVSVDCTLNKSVPRLCKHLQIKDNS